MAAPRRSGRVPPIKHYESSKKNTQRRGVSEEERTDAYISELRDRIQAEIKLRRKFEQHANKVDARSRYRQEQVLRLESELTKLRTGMEDIHTAIRGATAHSARKNIFDQTRNEIQESLTQTFFDQNGRINGLECLQNELSGSVEGHILHIKSLGETNKIKNEEIGRLTGRLKVEEYRAITAEATVAQSHQEIGQLKAELTRLQEQNTTLKVNKDALHLMARKRETDENDIYRQQQNEMDRLREHRTKLACKLDIFVCLNPRTPTCAFNRYHYQREHGII